MIYANDEMQLPIFFAENSREACEFLNIDYEHLARNTRLGFAVKGRYIIEKIPHTIFEE